MQAADKSLGEFDNNDVDMEDSEDENESPLANNFKKQLLMKRKKLNDECGMTADTRTIEESMANLSINEIFTKAKSVDLSDKLYGITQIRKFVSTSDNCVNDDIIKNDILPVLVECLSHENSEIQFEAAWILTNIAAGTSDQTKVLYDAFVHLQLLKLFGSDCDVNVANQALWTIGNIMADNKGFCYHCISAGITESLVKQMKRFSENLALLRTVSWITVQMCNLKDSPLFKETAWDLFPILWELLKQKDDEICINAIWGLGFLTDNGFDLLTNFNKKIVKDVVPHLDSANIELQASSLHFFANGVSGYDDLTQEIIDCGALKFMAKFLNHPNQDFVGEATWMLSNILAGTHEQVDAVFKAGLIPKIIDLLGSDEMMIKEKALWAITNIPLCFSPTHNNILLDLDVLPPLCRLITTSENRNVESIVKAINEIQQQCNFRLEEMRQKIIDSGGEDTLRRLQNHENENIQKYANQILTDLLFN